MRSRWRVGARWPTGPYMCSRRSTSLTGRLTSRAARIPRTCGPEMKPFEPKPPPRKGLRMWILSGEMPNSPAIRPCAMARPWLGVSIDSVSPSHAATIACGSMALWYWAGVSSVVSLRQQRRAFRRVLQRLGDHHRDRLVRITHLVVLQEIEPEHERVRLRVGVLRERRPVGGGHDVDDARMTLGRLYVKEGHATARNAGDRQNGVEHAGRMVVRRVAGFSFDFEDAVAAGQRLPDIGAVPGMGWRLGEAD